MEAGDALAGAGDFEVHVAEVVFRAEDVRQQHALLAVVRLGDQPMEMPATGDLIGTPASISARQPPQTVAIEVEPLEDMISLVRRVV